MKGNPPGLTFKNILWIGGILYSLLFFVCCLTPFIAPVNFLPFTYAAILFPYCFIGYLLWLLPVFIFFRKYMWIFLLLLIPAWKNAGVVFGPHIKSVFSYKKGPKQLRVLSWNVNGLLYLSTYDLGSGGKKQAMMEFIRSADADILCFQDYMAPPPNYQKADLSFLRDSLKYPYQYFSDDCNSYGTAIFSRLPIIDSGHIKYKGRKYPESLAFITVPFVNDTLRIFNTHLHSMYLHADSLSPATVGYMEFIKEDTAFLLHSSRLERMAYFDRIHTGQAKIIKEELNKIKTPYIFCADLNTVPSSYVYHYIKDGLDDAFLAQGYGLGGTYHRFSFSLRIDVILLSRQLKATQYFSPRPDLSDHYPVITDIQLQK